jgi:hypothetical protein
MANPAKRMVALFLKNTISISSVAPMSLVMMAQIQKKYRADLSRGVT